MAIPEPMLVSQQLQRAVDQIKRAQASGTQSQQREQIDTPPRQAAIEIQQRPLHALAGEILGAADQHGQTTILMAGHRTQLRMPLYRSLTDSLAELAQRAIHWEVLAPPQVRWPYVYHLKKHQRMINRLRQAMPSGTEVSSCFRFSRPAGPSRPLKIGLVKDTRSLETITDTPYFRVALLDSIPHAWIDENETAQVIRYRLVPPAKAA